MSFLMKDQELLEKYTETLGKICLKKEFDSELVFKGKYLKAKIKS